MVAGYVYDVLVAVEWARCTEQWGEWAVPGCGAALATSRVWGADFAGARTQL